MKESHIALLLISTVLLAGCGPSAEQIERQKAQQRINEFVAKCPKEDWTRKNVVAKTECYSQVSIAQATLNNYPHMALIYQTTAAYKDLAIQYEAGQISKRKFEAQREHIYADLRQAIEEANEADRQRQVEENQRQAEEAQAERERVGNALIGLSNALSSR